MSYSDHPKCHWCDSQATCYGSYEGHTGYACDGCCAHMCHDGWCEELGANPMSDSGRQIGDCQHQGFYISSDPCYLCELNRLRTALRGGKGAPPEGVMHKNLEYFAKLIEEQHPQPEGGWLVALMVSTLMDYAASIRNALEKS